MCSSGIRGVNTHPPHLCPQPRFSCLPQIASPCLRVSSRHCTLGAGFLACPSPTALLLRTLVGRVAQVRKSEDLLPEPSSAICLTNNLGALSLQPPPSSHLSCPLLPPPAGPWPPNPISSHTGGHPQSQHRYQPPHVSHSHPTGLSPPPSGAPSLHDVGTGAGIYDPRGRDAAVLSPLYLRPAWQRRASPQFLRQGPKRGKTGGATWDPPRLLCPQRSGGATTESDVFPKS